MSLYFLDLVALFLKEIKSRSKLRIKFNWLNEQRSFHKKRMSEYKNLISFLTSWKVDIPSSNHILHVTLYLSSLHFFDSPPECNVWIMNCSSIFLFSANTWSKLWSLLNKSREQCDYQNISIMLDTFPHYSNIFLHYKDIPCNWDLFGRNIQCSLPVYLSL